MKHKSEIIQKHQQGFSISRIIQSFSNYHYTTEQIAEVIAQSEIKIQTEQFYIVPSKMNYEII